MGVDLGVSSEELMFAACIHWLSCDVGVASDILLILRGLFRVGVFVCDSSLDSLGSRWMGVSAMVRAVLYGTSVSACFDDLSAVRL